MRPSIKWQELEFESDDDQPGESGEVGYYANGIGIMTPNQLNRLRSHIPKVPERKCYWGFTNFNITDYMQREIICEFEGVEFARAFSRYAFLITVGINFNDKEVRQGLQKELLKYAEDQ